jgi:hypothetical protein
MLHVRSTHVAAMGAGHAVLASSGTTGGKSAGKNGAGAVSRENDCQRAVRTPTTDSKRGGSMSLRHVDKINAAATCATNRQ